MLQPISHVLAKKRIILASGSPRRKTILSNVGLDFEVVVSTFDENLDKSDFDQPCDYVKETARLKATEVADKLQNESPAPDLIIGADTVVTMDGTIFEKPRDHQDAFNMLTRFSGRSHAVCTGVVLLQPRENSKHPITAFHEETEVWMSTLTDDIIEAYIKTGEPMDKAGGYGIQALGGTLVEGIKGDYFNVMGFPVHKFSKLLLDLYSDE